jgi:hypothetical protein
MATTTAISELTLPTMRDVAGLLESMRILLEDKAERERIILKNEQVADESREDKATSLMRRETSMGKTSWAWRNPHVYSYELAEMKASWR